jgi:hypothetical protein
MGDELDDKQVIIHPAHEVVVFQTNDVVCLIVVHDDVIWCPETLWETHVKHVASECLGPWSLRTEVVPLSVIAPPPLDVVICTVHILHDLVPPGQPDGACVCGSGCFFG